MRIPFIAVAVFGILGLILDTYIYKDIKTYHKNSNWQKKLYAWLAVITMSFVIVIFTLPYKDEKTDILPIMWMLYFWLIIYVAKLVYCLISLSGRLLKLLLSKEINLGLYVGVSTALLVASVMLWGAFVTRYDIDVNRVVVNSKELPMTFDGYRIVHISDMHVGTWGKDTSFISLLVDTINSIKPDAVLFTGDIVNRNTYELRPFLNILSKIKAPDGVFSILGNHDYGDYTDWKSNEMRIMNNREMIRLQDSIGWKLLDNNHQFITKYNENSAMFDSIVIIGVGNWGEAPFRHYANLKKAYANINDSKYKILLSHNPKHWKEAICDSTNINLTLAGHTHAMQLVLSFRDWKWSPSSWRYPEWGGEYQHCNSAMIQTLYVNIGVGEVGMPYRIGAIPEITEITLRR